MKIGIFGDSFAAPSAPHVWSLRLRDSGHECTSYGQGGSSIWYSVRLLQKHADQHDFLIWCATMPGRLSLQTKELPPPHNWVHWRWKNPITEKYKDVGRMQEIFRDYYLNLVDLEEDNLLYSSLVYRLMTIYPNLMVIPCFPPPLKMQFNLWDLCCHEIRLCFKEEEKWRHWYQDYDDPRPGHLTQENHAILTQEILANLRPGIFQTTYDKFVQVSTLDGVLVPKKFVWATKLF